MISIFAGNRVEDGAGIPKRLLVAQRYKRRLRGSRGWFYWFKKYRGDRGLDELNQQPLPLFTGSLTPGRHD